MFSSYVFFTLLRGEKDDVMNVLLLYIYGGGMKKLVVFQKSMTDTTVWALEFPNVAGILNLISITYKLIL